MTYYYDRRTAARPGLLTQWVQKESPLIEDARALRELEKAAKRLDEKHRALNPDDRWTLAAEVKDFGDLAYKYVGYRPRVLDRYY